MLGKKRPDSFIGGKVAFQIVNNKIHAPTDCELNVVHHCNMSCRGCTHLAPVLEKHFADPNTVFNDFSILGKYYRPKSVKILGGEPLLHPNLLQVIDAVRSSELTNYIHIVTNGQLLAEMPDSFWEKVDEVQISVYPRREISHEHLKIFQQKAKLYSVAFEYFYFDNFRESYSELGTTDTKLVQQIYSTCKMAHLWHCHTVDNGYFYKCPLSLFIPKIINNDMVKLYQDGIKITDSPEFANDLLSYLGSGEPLGSCHHCLGSVGKVFAHEQRKRKEWRLQQQFSTEELIDREYLAILENTPDAKDMCTRYRSPVKNLLVRAQRTQRNFVRRLRTRSTEIPRT